MAAAGVVPIVLLKFKNYASKTAIKHSQPKYKG